VTFWDKVRSVLRRDKAELDAFVDDANQVMDRKERELHATPEEKLEAAQAAADAADAEYEDLKRKLERG
jgi:ABC-type transporter Mla subunit MlaD